MALHKSLEVQQVYEKHKSRLSYLFELLYNFTFKDISYLHEGDELPLRTINWFCQHFSLTPEIIKSIEVGLMFRTITKNTNKHPPSLTYQDFLQFLTRVSIKGQNVFNRFAEHMKEGEIDQSKMDQIISQEQQLQQNDSGNQDKTQNQISGQSEMALNMSSADIQQDKILSSLSKMVDNYGNVDAVSHKTIECLIYYLDLPSDRNGINQRFNAAKLKKLEPNRFLKNSNPPLTLHRHHHNHHHTIIIATTTPS